MIHSILLEQNYQGRFYFGNHKTIISTCTVVVVLVKANLLVILKSEIGKFGLIHFCFKARLTSSIYPYFFSFPCNPFFHVPLIFIFSQGFVERIKFHDMASIEGNAVKKSVLAIHKGKPLFPSPLNIVNVNECCEGRLCHDLVIDDNECANDSFLPYMSACLLENRPKRSQKILNPLCASGGCEPLY